MDNNLQSRSPDNPDVKPSFRKPSNDVTNRQYRRRSPVGGSATSSSDGSPKRDRSSSPNYSRGDLAKTFSDRRRRDDGRDLDRESSRSRYMKDADTHRYSERRSHRDSHEYHRREEYGSRYHRHVEEDERSYHRSSRIGREPRGSTYSDNTREDNDHDRSREERRNTDKYFRDKTDDRGHRIKEKERDAGVKEHYRHGNKDFSHRNTDGTKYGEKDKHHDRGLDQDERKEKGRGAGDHKNDYVKDSSMGRDAGGSHGKETHKSNSKDLDGQKEEAIHKRKHDDREQDKHSRQHDRERETHVENFNRNSSSYRERDYKTGQYQDKDANSNEDKDSAAKKLKSSHSDKATDCADDGPLLSKSSKFDEKPTSNSKPVQETVGKSTSEPSHSSASEAEVAQDLNAAKVAAMKAAELVNRNLVGTSYLSADQKKKLLWGNKKNTTTEESGNRWDMTLFPDRERQEKFNKLMSLRLPWWLWPIVGCESRYEPGEQTQRQGSCRAGAAPDGLGEAVHCRSPSEGWSDSRAWTVRMESISSFRYSVKTVLGALSLYLNFCMKHEFLTDFCCWIVSPVPVVNVISLRRRC